MMAAATDTPGALDRFLAIYDRRLLERTRPYEAIPEVLATLASSAGSFITGQTYVVDGGQMLG